MIGDELELDVTAVAHGGHCVARHDGQVVFVRHALPGERVRARVTEVRRSYLRADAVDVLRPAADRVSPECPYSGAGGCGGCDLQHVGAAGQLRWKEQVITEQLTRLGGLSQAQIAQLAVRVQPLPGGGGGWRTRVRYAVDADGRAGLLAHRSHRVVPVQHCMIAAPGVQQQRITDQRWPGADAVSVVASVAGDVTVRRWRDQRAEPVRGPDRVRERVLGRQWSLSPEVFWQVHPAAPEALATAVCELLSPRDGERSWDLYGGAGLFAAALATSGRAAAVTLVESSAQAVAAAREHLADLPVSVVRGRVDAVLRRRRLPVPVDTVVLDPPRAGAGAAVVNQIVAAAPRAVAYVACDPAAFARDVAAFSRRGWSLVALRAFDCFPHTHHVECVGLLQPGA